MQQRTKFVQEKKIEYHLKICFEKLIDFYSTHIENDKLLVTKILRTVPRVRFLARNYLDNIVFKQLKPLDLDIFPNKQFENLFDFNRYQKGTNDPSWPGEEIDHEIIQNCINKDHYNQQKLSKEKLSLIDNKISSPSKTAQTHSYNSAKSSKIKKSSRIKREGDIEQKPKDTDEIKDCIDNYNTDLQVLQKERLEILQKINFEGIEFQNKDEKQMMESVIEEFDYQKKDFENLNESFFKVVKPTKDFLKKKEERQKDDEVIKKYLELQDLKKKQNIEKMSNDLKEEIYNTLNKSFNLTKNDEISQCSRKYELKYAFLQPNLYENNASNPVDDVFCQKILNTKDFEKQFAGNCLICNKDKVAYSVSKIDEGHIYYCTICKSGYHFSCYGCEDMKKSNEWVCELCKRYYIKGHFLQCGLCPWRGGCLRETKFKLGFLMNINIHLEKYKQDRIQNKELSGLERQLLSGSQKNTVTTQYFDDKKTGRKSYNYYDIEKMFVPGLLPKEPIPENLLVHQSCFQFNLLHHKKAIKDIEEGYSLNVQCEICSFKAVGFCIKCGHPKCEKYFHVECLRRSNFPTKKVKYSNQLRNSQGKEFEKFFKNAEYKIKDKKFPLINYKYYCIEHGVKKTTIKIKDNIHRRQKICLDIIPKIYKFIEQYNQRLNDEKLSPIIQVKIEDLNYLSNNVTSDFILKTPKKYLDESDLNQNNILPNYFLEKNQIIRGVDDKIVNYSFKIKQRKNDFIFDSKFSNVDSSLYSKRRSNLWEKSHSYDHVIYNIARQNKLYEKFHKIYRKIPSKLNNTQIENFDRKIQKIKNPHKKNFQRNSNGTNLQRLNSHLVNNVNTTNICDASRNNRIIKNEKNNDEEELDIFKDLAKIKKSLYNKLDKKISAFAAKKVYDDVIETAAKTHDFKFIWRIKLNKKNNNRFGEEFMSEKKHTNKMKRSYNLR